ncbi:MAG: hypothetical protein ACC682_09130 [Gemmatimonadota bacterium]
MLANKRLLRPAGLIALLAAVSLAASGCWVLWEDDGPAEVTRDFWSAARDGNEEMVEALSVNRPGNFTLDSDGGEVRSISIGDTDIDGDEAEVETVLEGIDNGNELTIEFETALVKRDGEWFVEMGETTGRLMGAVMAALGNRMGEAVSEAMGEMADGLAESMEELGEALQESAKEMRESGDNR